MGSVAVPVSADATIAPPAPALMVATAKAPARAAPPTFTMPSPVGVTARATMSGAGVPDADINNVLTPDVMGAGLVFEHSKPSRTSVGGRGPVGVRATTKLCAAPVAISTAVPGVPMVAFDAGSVVW